MKQTAKPGSRRGPSASFAIVLAILFGFGWYISSGTIYCGPRARWDSSTVRSDLRSLATAIESYGIDHGVYPAGRPLAGFGEKTLLAKAGGDALSTIETGREGLHGLTTPVAYLSNISPDAFSGRNKSVRIFPDTPVDQPWPFAYAAFGTPNSPGGGWIAWSTGPDGIYDIRDPAAVYDPSLPVPSPELVELTFDPTNGWSSCGDIYRVHVARQTPSPALPESQ